MVWFPVVLGDDLLDVLLFIDLLFMFPEFVEGV